jgi:hypothetical protein
MQPPRVRLFSYIPILIAAMLLLETPASAFASEMSQTVQGQPTPQDSLTIIIWTIAALSIAEMIRNTLQGLFARLSGFNEMNFAQKAVGAIAGMGALFGLASLGKTTLSSNGAQGGWYTGGQNSAGMKLSGEAVPDGDVLYGAAAVGQAGITTASSGKGSGPETYSVKNAGFMRAAQTGSSLGKTMGSFASNTATVGAGAIMSMAGAAIPGGERLAAMGQNAFRHTAGRLFGYTGEAAGRFVGANASLLGQSYAVKRQSSGQMSVGDAFKMVAGGSTFEEAMSRSLKFSTAHSLHPGLGRMALEGLTPDAQQADRTSNNTSASMDGVRYS